MDTMSSDAFCIDNLHYTYYQTRDHTQDTLKNFPMSSTPDRAHIRTHLPWHDMLVRGEAFPRIESTPRSLITPTTSSLSMGNMPLGLSPSPLSLSQVPSLVYPELSPPSQGSSNTPFERQFTGDFPREWISPNTQISPVTRANAYSSFYFAPSVSHVDGTASGTDFDSASQDSQDSVGRVSLMERFISAAADESATTEDVPHLSAFHFQDRSSPLSDLSDLTPLSSPGCPERFRCELNSRRSSPPTSPTGTHRRSNSRPSDMQHDDQPHKSGRESSPSSSSQGSSPSRDSEYQPARGIKRKRTPRSSSVDKILTRRQKRKSTNASGGSSTDALAGTLTRRFPTNIPYHPQYSLLYLRFPVSSYLRLNNEEFPLLSGDSKRVAGVYNEPRDALDLYTPRFVKGCGATKVGLCPICIESPSRGGKGEANWLSMKFSAYKWVVRFIREILT
ncbi:hypothetical protein JVU11DRAFT_6983 [Chiua virens]|nr:hypothetical protein JVU11DRAFT_6983 [Chiua virens]